MNKRIADDIPTKAKKRELKKRPRMTVHGRSLLKPNLHAGKKITKK